MANDKSEAIIIVTSIFLALSLLAVSLRCYVRLHLIRAFGADDYMMVLAMAFNLAFAICGIAGGSTGLGKKMNYFADKPTDLRDSLRVCSLLCSMCPHKTSFLFTRYSSIFSSGGLGRYSTL